jgi:hypothetical protein
MATNDHALDQQLSNWTLATGTKPGERHVYGATSRRTARHSVPDARS